MENKYHTFIDKNGDSVIEKEKGYMTINDLHTILAGLIKQGKGKYCIHFEAWSSVAERITVDDKAKDVSLD